MKEIMFQSMIEVLKIGSLWVKIGLDQWFSHVFPYLTSGHLI